MSKRQGGLAADDPASNVVVFAFACDPEKGSEPGAGWVAVQTIAGIAESVTVVTRAWDAPQLEARAVELGEHVTIMRIGVPGVARRSTYLAYGWWTLRAAACVRRQHGQDKFSLMHHVTYASDWFINPLMWIDDRSVRMVLGPAGGATHAPMALSLKYGFSVLAADTVRRITTGLFRRLL